MHKTHDVKTKCAFSGCKDHPISFAEHCWKHIPDKTDYRSKLVELLNKGEDMSGHNLQKVDLREIHLEKTSFARANLSQANLTGAHLFNVNFENADLIGVTLSNCDMTHCDLKNCDLTKAVIADSRLWNANLSGANLTECDLTGSDMWHANLFNIKLWHTTIKDVKSLTKHNFGKKTRFYEKISINESGLLSAAESYRDLKGFFLRNGMYNDASWAAFKEMTMERLIYRKNGDLRYFPSMIMNILCGYGEKPYRIIVSALTTILSYAAVYAAFQAVDSTIYTGYKLRWFDYIYYSTITFTTVGYGDFIPKPDGIFRLLAAAEAFTGVYLSGLFIFTLARKYSAR